MDVRPKSSKELGVDAEDRATSAIQGRKVSFLLSWFNLLSTIVGSGILGLAFTVQFSGIVAFVVLITAMAAVTNFSLQLLLITARWTGRHSWEELAALLLGERGQLATSALVVVQTAGSMTSYSIILRDVIKGLLHHVAGGAFVWLNPNVLFAAYTVVVILPLSSSSSMGFLGLSSSVATVAVFAFVAVMARIALTMDCTALAPLVQRDPAVACEMNWVEPSFFDTCLMLPTMAFAFVCHTSLLPIMQEQVLADGLGRTYRGPSRMVKVTRLSVLTALALYVGSAVSGHVAFRRLTNPDLLTDLSLYLPDDPLSLMIRGIFALGLSLHIPLNVFPCRRALCDIVSPGYDEGSAAVTTLLIGFMLLVTVYVPEVTTVFVLTGSISSIALLFLLPPILYRRALHRIKSETAPLLLSPISEDENVERGATLLLYCGGVVAVLSWVAILSSLRSSSPIL